MPYVGGSLVSLFDEDAQAATRLAVRRMADAAGERVTELTVMNTPIESGNLRSSWHKIPTQRFRHPLGPAWQSGVETNVDYAPYVEEGTGLWGPSHSKYPIRPKTPGGVLRWRGPDGQYVYAREVMHPGSPGQHMVAIALEATEMEFESGELVAEVLHDWVLAVETGAD